MPNFPAPAPINLTGRQWSASSSRLSCLGGWDPTGPKEPADRAVELVRQLQTSEPANYAPGENFRAVYGVRLEKNVVKAASLKDYDANARKILDIAKSIKGQCDNEIGGLMRIMGEVSLAERILEGANNFAPQQRALVSLHTKLYELTFSSK
ncbi:MAG: hypothetical protein ACK5PW_19560 [Burkholderiales bacterium]